MCSSTRPRPAPWPSGDPAAGSRGAAARDGALGVRRGPGRRAGLLGPGPGRGRCSRGGPGRGGTVDAGLPAPLGGRAGRVDDVLDAGQRDLGQRQGSLVGGGVRAGPGVGLLRHLQPADRLPGAPAPTAGHLRRRRDGRGAGGAGPGRHRRPGRGSGGGPQHVRALPARRGSARGVPRGPLRRLRTAGLDPGRPAGGALAAGGAVARCQSGARGGGVLAAVVRHRRNALAGPSPRRHRRGTGAAGGRLGSSGAAASLRPGPHAGGRRHRARRHLAHRRPHVVGAPAAGDRGGRLRAGQWTARCRRHRVS